MTIKNNEVPRVPKNKLPRIIVLMVLPLEILAMNMPTNGPRPKNQAHINIDKAFENSDFPNGGGPTLMVKKFLIIKTQLSIEFLIMKRVVPKNSMYIRTKMAI